MNFGLPLAFTNIVGRPTNNSGGRVETGTQLEFENPETSHVPASISRGLHRRRWVLPSPGAGVERT